jgi:hypothetical protein
LATGPCHGENNRLNATKLSKSCCNIVLPSREIVNGD